MLWWVLLGCAGGGIGADAPLSVSRGSPWADLALPEGRTVSSASAGLTVRTDDPPATADAAWDGALQALGFVVLHDASRGPSITRTYARGVERWALSIVAVAGQTTVDLRVLPPEATP